MKNLSNNNGGGGGGMQLDAEIVSLLIVIYKSPTSLFKVHPRVLAQLTPKLIREGAALLPAEYRKEATKDFLVALRKVRSVDKKAVARVEALNRVEGKARPN